jgi:hypothetical protein
MYRRVANEPVQRFAMRGDPDARLKFLTEAEGRPRQSEGAWLACTLTGRNRAEADLILARQLTTQFNIETSKEGRPFWIGTTSPSDHREHNRHKADCLGALGSHQLEDHQKQTVEEPNCRKCASEGKTVPASHVATLNTIKVNGDARNT